MDLFRLLRALRSLLGLSTWIHAFRILHFYRYAHVEPLRKATVGRGVAMAPNVSLRNGDRVVIGDGAHVGERCRLWAGDHTGRIILGPRALLAPDVFLTASNYRFDEGAPVMDQAKDEADVVIGEDVWLGAGVMVLPGVTIGDGAVVAAGSVVTVSLPAWSVSAGVPAKVRRMRRKTAGPAALVTLP